MFKPTTPIRRASSAGPPSQRPLRRTPATQARTPITANNFGGSVRRPTVVTPHGRAAMREVEARRAGLTPGKDRRRSGRQQRETPRDTLRALSRLLAPKTERIVPTPPRQGPDIKVRKYEEDDLDDEPDPVRPRLSMPLDDDNSDEDDSLLLPPRSAGIENEDYTGYSIELPRRAISEQAPGRLSRGSFGSIRMSDQFANLNEAGPGHVFDSSFAMGGPFDDEMPDMHNDLPREDTGTLRNLGFALGRESDIRPDLFVGDDSENTFVFNVPPRDVPEPQRSPSEPDPPLPFSDNERSSLDAMSDRNVGLEGREEGVSMPDIEEPEELDIAMGSDVDPDMDEQDESLIELIQAPKVVKKKKVKLSKHGIIYPSLPVGVVKRLATLYAKTGGNNNKAKISKDTLDAIMQASDWFFEQVSDDLGAYANHAGRKTIDESDVITLMKRQRQINSTTTPFSLAQKHLPRELLQELRMVPPPKLKKGKQLAQINEEEED